MKLAFSTLGCPNWTWNEILAAARDLEYSGIELRGIGDDIYMPDSPLFSPEHITARLDELKARGLSVYCVSSDVCLRYEHDRDELSAARCYIALAANLKAPYLRILADSDPHPYVGGLDDGVIVEKYQRLIPLAHAAGVTLLIETNGVYADTGRLRNLLRAVNSPTLQVLWDINHPARYFDEAPERTFENIGEYVRHIHIKDSNMENGRIAYKMLGYGDLPVKRAFSCLKQIGYDGSISLEWVKRWNTELEDAGVVFSHFAYAARKIWEEA